MGACESNRQAETTLSVHIFWFWFVSLVSKLMISMKYSGVRSCYDEGKRTAETLTMDYHRGAGVEVCIKYIVINTIDTGCLIFCFLLLLLLPMIS